MAARNERDEQARLALLEQIWSRDGVYFDALANEPAVGRLAMSRLMAEFQGPIGGYCGRASGSREMHTTTACE